MSKKQQLLLQKMRAEDIEILKRRVYEPASTATNEAQNDIFIVHADEDNAMALRLEHELKVIFGAQLRVFNSSNPTGIKGGFDWFHHITTQHRNSKMGLILITKASIKNLWIHFEAGGFFLPKDNPAIPIFFDRNDLRNLEFPLKGIQGKKLWEREFRETLIAEIAAQLAIKEYSYDDNRFLKMWWTCIHKVRMREPIPNW